LCIKAKKYIFFVRAAPRRGRRRSSAPKPENSVTNLLRLLSHSDLVAWANQADRHYQFDDMRPYRAAICNHFFIVVFVISLPIKREIYYLQYNYIVIYIIYGDRTTIGFVGLVANLLNRPTDGATVSVRKRVTFRPLMST
jgi:hypothetical protein